MPLQPSAPLLRDKGQSEVAASFYLSGRLEGSVAYSPAKHVLVRAAGGLSPNNEDSVSFHIRQFEVGTGTYWSLSDQWLVGALGGYGRGQSQRRFTINEFEYSGPDPSIRFNYASRFHKLYGEAFVAYEGDWATIGAAYRLSQVRFASLTNNGLPVDLRRMTRSEPMVFMRFGNRTGFLPWGQFQVALSTSWSPDYEKSVPIEQHRAYIKESRVFTSVGFVIYPHRFRRDADY
ncbi:hypothetical protein [Hymenobacter roseosalivarius]|uniref:hypothetical protein n=1 Tax=Hymenobacter roseosalivarius TaxID=89967 RepID=UPI000A002FFC|nr:hypothetical protein [Hymenobacter roseosalivarius]